MDLKGTFSHIHSITVMHYEAGQELLLRIIDGNCWADSPSYLR